MLTVFRNSHNPHPPGRLTLRPQEERRRQEEEDTFQAELEARRKAAELDQDLMLDQWQTEEAERELQRKLAEEANEARIKADVEDRARRAREAEAMVVALRREKGITKVMRARRLRHLEEDSKHLQHAAQAARDKEAALLAEESKAAMRQLLLQESKQREEESAKRLAVVEEARRQLELEEELRRKRLLQLEQIQNRRLYEEQVIKNRQADLEASKREEEQVQAALAAIEAQRRYAREQELKRLMLEQETKERAAFLVSDSVLGGAPCGSWAAADLTRRRVCVCVCVCVARAPLRVCSVKPKRPTTPP